MKKYRILAALLCGLLLLPGCGGSENPYRVDTVVRIPVDPTDAPTEAPETTAPAETEEPARDTEATEGAETVKPSSGTSTKKSSSGKSSTKKNSSSGSSSKSDKTGDTEAATEPVTEAPTQAPAEDAFDPSDYSVGSLEKAVLKELNAVRADAGLSELTMSTRLCGMAALRAREIGDLWSHGRPDGRSYTTAMSDYGYGFGVSAENLAYAVGSGDASVIVTKWMDHENKDSILSGSFTTAGIGIYRDDGVTYIVNLLTD